MLETKCRVTQKKKKYHGVR